jgi:hypothetical protein
MAHRVVTLLRSNSVAFGLKRTWAGLYEYTALRRVNHGLGRRSKQSGRQLRRSKLPRRKGIEMALRVSAFRQLAFYFLITMRFHRSTTF